MVWGCMLLVFAVFGAVVFVGGEVGVWIACLLLLCANVLDFFIIKMI